jgi:hypothetical protein
LGFSIDILAWLNWGELAIYLVAKLTGNF